MAIGRLDGSILLWNVTRLPAQYVVCPIALPCWWYSSQADHPGTSRIETDGAQSLLHSRRPHLGWMQWKRSNIHLDANWLAFSSLSWSHEHHRRHLFSLHSSSSPRPSSFLFRSATKIKGCESTTNIISQSRTALSQQNVVAASIRRCPAVCDTDEKLERLGDLHRQE